MKTGAAYIRVSTEDQLEYSPESQLKKIQEYGRQHQITLENSFVFCDEGISGRNAGNRPEFMRMIRMAKKKPRPFDVILVWKFSRFARNRQDSIFYKSMLRKDCGIDVISVTEQLGNDPTAILIEALLEAMDEYYSVNLAQEVRRGMNEKFSRGGVVSAPPFGYHMGKGKFVVDGEKGAAVRMIFEDYLRGFSFRKISARLNEMGICTNRGNPFGGRTVAYILSNPVYMGKMRRNVEKEGEVKTVLADGDHEPLIGEDTFYAVQQLMGKNKRARKESSGGCRKEFMLQGLVRCSCCGSTLTRTAAGKAIQCCRYARGLCLESHYITLDKLNQAVMQKIEEDLEGAEAVIPELKKKEVMEEKDVEMLLKAERRRRRRIEEAYEKGIDTLEEYGRKKAAVLNSIRDLEKRGTEQQSGKVWQKKIKAGDLIRMLSWHSLSEGDKNGY
jgi:site-specific DNA recombinase